MLFGHKNGTTIDNWLMTFKIMDNDVLNLVNEYIKMGNSLTI